VDKGISFAYVKYNNFYLMAATKRLVFLRLRVRLRMRQRLRPL